MVIDSSVGGLLALFAGIALIGLVIFLVVYIYSAFALMTIAKKTKTDNAWLAWIPIANLYLITKIAGVQWWTALFILAIIVPIIGGLAVLGLTAWWFWKISEVRGKPGWLGILMIIPIANLIVLGILAWAD